MDMDFISARKNRDGSRGNFTGPQQVTFTSRQAASDNLLQLFQKNSTEGCLFLRRQSRIADCLIFARRTTVGIIRGAGI